MTKKDEKKFITKTNGQIVPIGEDENCGKVTRNLLVSPLPVADSREDHLHKLISVTNGMSEEITSFISNNDSFVNTLGKIFSCEEKELFVVGGALRAIFLGEKPHDMDLCTNASPDLVTRILNSRGIRVVPTGIKHGTVTAYKGTTGYEITTYRKDGSYSDGLRPDQVSYAVNIEEDLARRDFTFNAMAFDLLTGVVVDPFNGREDLLKKRVRTVLDPYERISENPIRLMRGLRFACQYGFTIEDETMKAFKANAFEVEDSSRFPREMIKREMDKGLAKNPTRMVDLMSETGVLEKVAPELTMMKGFDQRSPHHHFDLMDHTLMVMEKLPKIPTLQWVALFHDVGKIRAQSYCPDKGHCVYYGHEKESKIIASEIMKRLKFSNVERRHVKNLIRFHMPHSGLIDHRKNAKVVRRWMAKVRSCYKRPVEKENARVAPYQLLEFYYADRLAKGVTVNAKEVKRQLNELQKTMTVVDSCTTSKKPPVTGYDVMEKGYRGKTVGEQLEKIADYYIDHPKARKKELLDLLGTE